MTIIVSCLSPFVKSNDLKIWVKNYQKQNIQSKCILITDKITTAIKESWPYEMYEKTIHNAVLLESKTPELEELNIRMLNCVQKLNCYMLFGPCVVIEPYSIFVKSQMEFPECDFGLIKKVEFSKLYKETETRDFFNHMDNPNFLERVELHTMILKKNVAFRYAELYYKNLDKLKNLGYSYPEFILSAVHKLESGVYISEDYGWPTDALIRNKTRLIDYFPPTRRHLLTFSNFNDMVIKFNGEEVRGTLND